MPRRGRRAWPAAASRQPADAPTPPCGRRSASRPTRRSPNPLFTSSASKRARFFPPWNVALKPQRGRLARRPGSTAAQRPGRAAGQLQPGARLGVPAAAVQAADACASTRGVPGLPQALAAGEGDRPWNEANHRSQPTFKNPKRAAQYYNIVRANCRGCKIVAADVIDETNMERWLKDFRRYAKRPRIWGLHNYRDTNQRKGQKTGGTRRLLQGREGRGVADRDRRDRQVRAAERRHAVPVARAAPNRATKRMFALAKQYRARIKRLYIYNWRQPAVDNRFDAGLLRADGTARPAYNTVRSAAAHEHVQPVGVGSPAASGSAGPAVFRHRSAAGPRGAARGGARGRGGHGAAARQARERRRARRRGRRLPAAVRRARRAVLAERPAGPGAGAAGPTACTWARTTCRRRRRVDALGDRTCSSGSPPTRPRSSTRALRRRAADQLASARSGRRPRRRGGPRPGSPTSRYAAARRRRRGRGSRSAGSTWVTCAR